MVNLDVNFSMYMTGARCVMICFGDSMDSMRVFDQFSPQRQARVKSGVKKSSKKEVEQRPVRMQLSASEIRAKVEENSKPKVEKVEKPKGQKLGDGFLNESVKVDRAAMKALAQARAEAPKDHTLPSDIDKNEPDNPVTTEKLKTILGSGGFSFNPKEREVLSKILEDK